MESLTRTPAPAAFLGSGVVPPASKCAPMNARRTLAVVATATLLGAASPPGLATPLVGIFALPGAVATTSATLVARPLRNDPLEVRLDIVLRRAAGGSVVRRYDVDMTKLLHLVIVSDDFKTFLHVHPRLQSDGHFTLAERFPRPALYHAYADTSPHGLGHQVFRFDRSVGGGRLARARELAPTGSRVRTGPYTVVLDRVRLRAGADNRVVVRVLAGATPASDLHPYLGALAHAVLLNGATLSYAHVHPTADMPGMDMPGMDMSAMPALATGTHVDPNMVLHVGVGRPGPYKLWLQFQGGKRIYVAPFVLLAT